MTEVALCVPVFSRRDKLRKTLDSAEDIGISNVYVADDGEKTSTAPVYKNDYSFELTVFDLEYDAGVGYKRNELVEVTNEPYLLFIDSDMEVPESYKILKHQLDSKPTFGAVTPMYIENGRLSTVATDFHEENNVLYCDIQNAKLIEEVDGYPFVQFDYLPNVGLFRRECLEDYCWDPEYTIQREHVDFYVGHWRETNWNFALSPSVYVRHYPGGGDDYLSERHSSSKVNASKAYFRKKWGYKSVEKQVDRWIDTYDPVVQDFPSPDSHKRLFSVFNHNGIIAGTKYACWLGLRKLGLK